MQENQQVEAIRTSFCVLEEKTHFVSVDVLFVSVHLTVQRFPVSDVHFDRIVSVRNT